jgi:predicted RNA binding protein YcfA (HicA-like mRNA interferase family)
MTEIPWGALRSLTAREIISALIRDGFSLHNQRGSHQRYRHDPQLHTSCIASFEANTGPEK